jgi:hypothetical protein
MKAVASCPIHNKIQLAALPPTSASANEHSFRVYHQVQQWLGVELPPTKWGWELTDGQLQPLFTRQPPAPEKLLSLISCNCKSGCERSLAAGKQVCYAQCFVAIAKEMAVYESDTDFEVKENEADSLGLDYEAFDFQMTNEDSL